MLAWLFHKVSTKSGLDPGGVWQAWGMASLKAGNLPGAREKFTRCLKPPVDRNQLNHGPLLLQEIVQHLETTVRPTLATVRKRSYSISKYIITLMVILRYSLFKSRTL